MTEHDPYRRTMAALLHAARSPRRYRTKQSYLHAVPARDRAYFERAWATLRRTGHLVIDGTAQTHRPVRYVAGR
jgi:hypothetical protein